MRVVHCHVMTSSGSSSRERRLSTVPTTVETISCSEHQFRSIPCSFDQSDSSTSLACRKHACEWQESHSQDHPIRNQASPSLSAHPMRPLGWLFPPHVRQPVLPTNNRIQAASSCSNPRFVFPSIFPLEIIKRAKMPK